jgi:hypothetical protein
MVKHAEDMNEESRSAGSKSDFMRLAGIGTDLADFVIAFLEKPEIFFSMPFERRRDIENQMDAILSSFEQAIKLDPALSKITST